MDKRYLNGKQWLSAVVLGLLVLLIGSGFSPVASEKPVVQAVMFWMDGCPHCHDVLDNVLPPIQAQYGEQFQITLIELVGGKEVDALYELAAGMGIAKEGVGVPFLIIGEYALVGSDEIAVQLSRLIEQFLAAGGVAYPNTAALAAFLPKQPVVEAEGSCAPYKPCADGEDKPLSGASLRATQAAAPLASRTSQAEVPNGFVLAIVVMIVMAAALVFSGLLFIKQYLRLMSYKRLDNVLHQPWVDWLSLLLIFVGIGVAGYLAYVETQAVSAVCGPIGDCNAVQSSPYARLFGVLPIGVLGLFGYIVILAAWLVRRGGDMQRANLASVLIYGMTFGGVLFSLYLTYLEPFVIKAVCMWCITSAVLMTLLLLLSIAPGLQALASLQGQGNNAIKKRKDYVEEKAS